MTPAPSVMDYSSRWASKLMTVKRLISNNARRQLVAVGERWESNGVIVYSPPSCSLLFLLLYLPRSYIAPHLKREKKKKKKKTFVFLFCLLQSSSFGGLQILLGWSCVHCKVAAGERGGGLPGKGEQALNTNKRARLCLPCPVRWEGEGAK